MSDATVSAETRVAGQPTCYIHVGPHKTGSSSLKHFIRGNLETLHRSGLFFPMLRDHAGRPAANHLELATSDEIKPNGSLRARAKLWPEIEEIASRGEMDILLSCEMFCRSFAQEGRLDPVLAYFKQHGYRVVIVAYIRDQPAWLNSWYVQSQKRFAALMTFDEFVDEADMRGRVEPLHYLAPFINHPDCELEIIPFERAIKSGLEDDFIRRCGLPAETRFEKQELRNPNAGAKSVFAAQEIMRRTGPNLQELTGFVSVCQAFKQQYVDHGWEATPFVALTDENVARIRARYAETNEAFARRFFGTTWAELCPAKPFGTSVFDPEQASWWERWKIDRLVRKTTANFAELRAENARMARKPRRRAG